MTTNRILFLTLSLALLAGVGCSQGNATTIKLSDFEIQPNGVHAVAGQPFALTLVNSGRVRHNLTLDPAVADVSLPSALNPGEKVSVTFTPKAAGAFTYWCGIPGHREAGMIGTLTVDEELGGPR